MNKKLPKVFANPINKELNNNREVFYSENRKVRIRDHEDILKKINLIFASVHHVYKSRVYIKTNDREFETFIVGRSGNNLLTLDGEKIRISDIVDIERL